MSHFSSVNKHMCEIGGFGGWNGGDVLCDIKPRGDSWKLAKIHFRYFKSKVTCGRSELS